MIHLLGRLTDALGNAAELADAGESQCDGLFKLLDSAVALAGGEFDIDLSWRVEGIGNLYDVVEGIRTFWSETRVAMGWCLHWSRSSADKLFALEPLCRQLLSAGTYGFADHPLLVERRYNFIRRRMGATMLWTLWHHTCQRDP